MKELCNLLRGAIFRTEEADAVSHSAFLSGHPFTDHFTDNFMEE